MKGETRGPPTALSKDEEDNQTIVRLNDRALDKTISDICIFEKEGKVPILHILLPLQFLPSFLHSFLFDLLMHV